MNKNEIALFEHKLIEFLQAANKCPSGIGDGMFSLSITIRDYPGMVATQIKGKRSAFLAKRSEDVERHLQGGHYDRVRELRIDETEVLICFQIDADKWSELYDFVGRNDITFTGLYREYEAKSGV